MKTKLKLTDLNVKSFTTTLDETNKKTIAGQEDGKTLRKAACIVELTGWLMFGSLVAKGFLAEEPEPEYNPIVVRGTLAVKWSCPGIYSCEWETSPHKCLQKK